jgi:protein SHQ1
MLVPKFRCSQDDKFVMIEIVISALCKVSEAQFDILEHQFTFSCSPYFLRLTFPCLLTEERGEKATYDVDTNTLTVYVPKLNIGEEFPGLDFPNQLLATSKQRKELGLSLITEVDGKQKNNSDDDDSESGNDGEDGELKAPKQKEENDEEHDEEENDDDDDEMRELETEFDQMLQVSQQTKRINEISAAKSKNNNKEAEEPKVYYGFNNQFSNFFVELDADLTRELLDVPNPDATLPLERKRLRRDDENANFDEGAFLFSMNDEDGEIENEILPFKPWYVQCFEEALIAAGRRNQQQQEQQEIETPGDIGSSILLMINSSEESSTVTNDAIKSKNESIWEGNTIQIVNNNTSADGEVNNDNDDEAQERKQTGEKTTNSSLLVESNEKDELSITEVLYIQKSSRNGLAFTVPAPKVPKYSMDEATSLQTIPAKNFFLHSEALVCWQLCDILAATVYDLLTTQCQGSVESSWTITKLSSC